MKKLSKREIVIASICAVIALGFILQLAVIEPLKQNEADILLKIQQKEKLMMKNLESINLMKDQESEYRGYLKFLTTTQSGEQEMSTMLSEVENLANETGIRMIGMKPRKVRKIDFYQKSSLEIEAEAQLTDLTQFIHQLEGHARPFIVEDIRLEKRSPQQPHLNCRLVLSRMFMAPDVEKKK